MKRKILIALGVVAALALAGFSWLWFAPCGMGGCAPVSELEKYQSEGSQLVDVNGHEFGTIGIGDRRVVPIDSLPPYLPKAFLAVEDRRFYQHGGVDWKRFVGALFKNVKSGGVEEGGSTITMQLARNLFPRDLPYQERSIRRKFMEMRVARQIEKRFSKDKILELYLNHIYLGEGTYGVDAAAREYFGKPASRLSIGEAAVLGGLPVSPARINPREDIDAATRRRDLVLREMAKAGYISQAQADSAIAQPIRLARHSATGPAVTGAWFIDRVRRELGDAMGDVDNQGGLKIFTTFDPVAQRAAEAEVARQAAAIESGAFGAFNHPTYAKTKGTADEDNTPYLQGMAVVMEATSGEIRALVGGRDYGDSKFDRVYQALRQPGSAFKPFVYLTALQHGIAPSQVYQDQPVRIVLARNDVWEPKNYTPGFDGPLTVREALTRSKNTITVQIAQQVGMDQVIETARALGIDTPIPNVPSAALGAAEVRPIELVRAYAAFDAGGALPTPHVIKRIEDDRGNVVWTSDAEPKRAIGPDEAFVLTSMLRDVVDRGTGAPARAAGFRGPAAGKTGTTNGATDVWFVGYTPELVGAVWFGFDKPQTIVPSASGGTLAAPVWARIMDAIYAHRRMPGAWGMPGGVTTAQVDRATGQVVQPGCPSSGAVYTEYFLSSAPPPAACTPSLPPGGMAMADTAWRDDESGAWSVQDTIGMSDLERHGIHWPELEAQRRRQAAGAPPPAPLPGNVEDPYGASAPAGSAAYPDAPPSGSATTGAMATPRRGRTRTPPPPPPVAETPPPADGGQTDGGSGTASRPPRVIGRPVGSDGGAGGGGQPAKPDSSGAGPG
jgi:penicillin-binding protein 1A